MRREVVLDNLWRKRCRWRLRDMLGIFEIVRGGFGRVCRRRRNVAIEMKAEETTAYQTETEHCVLLFFSSKNFEYVVEKIKKKYSSNFLIYVGLGVSKKPTRHLWREEISRFVREVRILIDGRYGPSMKWNSFGEDANLVRVV